MDWIAVLSGLAIGVIVGMTGVGGGSLMTPLLMSVFRLQPALAIGTDLWFAGLTKTSGALAHHRHRQVNWHITALLLAGSLPASLATIGLMHASGGVDGRWSGAITTTLGAALLLTALTVAWRGAWMTLGMRLERLIPARRIPALTWLCGLVLGALVSLSSIGAGAIGATLILLLYPRLDARHVVGTDISHAVPLTLVAGVGHATLGHVDWPLLAMLLVGSVPGIWIGAQLTRKAPERVVRALLCASLVAAAFKVLF